MPCIHPLQLGSRILPCGKCNLCLQAKRNDWSFRLSQEQRVSNASDFLTLTYSGEHIGKNHVIKTDLQKFFKRVRKKQLEYSQDKIRYYAVAEYGTRTNRAHYHAIVFNLHHNVTGLLPVIWNKGHVHVGTCTPASIHYTTKYIINASSKTAGRPPPFSLMSRKPGIGSNYLHTHTLWHTHELKTFTNVNGVKGRLPRFYKDRMFNEEEKEIISQRTLEESKIRMMESITALSEHHEFPYSYYCERYVTTERMIKNKINKLSKI